MTVIPVEKLHEVWPWVEKGLYDIKRKGNQSWFPADVYMQLRHETATLATIGDGFLIYQILPGDDFRGCLHVWLAWGKLKPHEEVIEDALLTIARAKRVRCIRAVGRKGWKRQGFFKLTGYVFEREVDLRPVS